MRQLRPAGTALFVTVLVLAGSAIAQPRAAAEPAFRVEWTVPDLPPAMAKIVGYVHNDSAYAVTDVRLHVVARDATGAAVEEAWGWVFGDVPAGGRAFFAVPITTPAAAFTVTVISFDVVARPQP